MDGSYCKASYDIVKPREFFGTNAVSPCMTSVLLDSLEVLLSAKMKRLSITRSPRSREVLRRQIQALKNQISDLAKSGAH